MKTILIFLALASTAFGQRIDSTAIDGTEAFPVHSVVIFTGTATIGAGDSVTVAAVGVSSTDYVLLTYASTGAEPVLTIVLSWRVMAANTLTIYGTTGKSVTFIIIR